MQTTKKPDGGFGLYTESSNQWFAALRKAGVKRYDVDPLVEVFSTKENIYHILAKSPGAGGDPWMHLIVGSERGLLIDTAYGIGNLKGLVEELLNGKPYDVVNTHFHGDHALGNYQFEKVYVHKYDAPLLEKQMTPHAWDRFLHTDDGKPPYFKPEDIVPYREYEIVPVENHHRFSLGDEHVIELIHMPGHAPGGCVLLDHKNRILFSGDALVYTPTMICGTRNTEINREFMTVKAFRNELEGLVHRTGEFDRLCPGHSRLDVPPSIVDDMLALCNRIIAYPEQYEYEFVGRDAKHGIVGLASIAYTDDRIG
jgi:glyoxylase-like metal-dependent hydrolase (beta-lactamase superfamily II)